jgi:hypothetical protein
MKKWKILYKSNSSRIEQVAHLHAGLFDFDNWEIPLELNKTKFNLFVCVNIKTNTVCTSKKKQNFLKKRKTHRI